MSNNENFKEAEERYSHFERPTIKRPPTMFNLTIWVVFVGLATGFFGYLLANYIIPNNSTNYFNINNPRDIQVDIEQPLTNIGSQYQKSIAGVYKNSLLSQAVGQMLFSQDDFLGSAVVVTSDGWLMTTDQVTTNKNVNVVLGNKIYSVDDLFKDEFSGTIFLKIDESFLQPVNFQLTDDIKIGEKLFTVVDIPNSYNHSFATTYLSNDYYLPYKYLFTDVLDYYIKISDKNDAQSSPYFNLDGDLIGLSYQLDEQTVLIPAEYIKQSVKHLLNNTDRVAIGIRYIDMENNSGFERNGSLVYNPQYSAVVYNSPAYRAGILSGDQIIAVNNDVVSGHRSLTSILQNYRPGDIVIVKVLRDKTEYDIELAL